MRETCDLYISGTINRTMVDKILEELQTDYYQPEKLLRLVIDSPGGSISMALTLARLLMNCFADIHTYNMSVVDSAAVCLYLCGNKRFASPSSRFFIHPPAISVQGEQTEHQLMEFCKACKWRRGAWWSSMANAPLSLVQRGRRCSAIRGICRLQRLRRSAL